jgi:TPR repeat protein
LNVSRSAAAMHRIDRSRTKRLRIEVAGWYRKAAEQGNAAGQSNLGVMYTEGRGVPQDDSAAVWWYRKAAEQDNARAQYNLGVMYAEGRGVPQDHAAAASWYQRAAEQGINGAEKKAWQARHCAQQREQERLRRRKDEQQETWRRGVENPCFPILNCPSGTASTVFAFTSV